MARGDAEDEGRPRRTRRRPAPREQPEAHWQTSDDPSAHPHSRTASPPPAQDQPPPRQGRRRPGTPRQTEEPPGHSRPVRQPSAPHTGHQGQAPQGGPTEHPTTDGSGTRGRSRNRRTGPRFGAPLSTGAIIGWTSLSAFIPGAAHLRSGNRKAGFILLGLFGVVLIATVLYGLQFIGNVGAAVRESTLVTVTVAAVVLALAWFVLVLMSYITLGPDRLPQKGQIVSGIVVGVLCVAVMAPFALTVTTVSGAQELLSAFPSAEDNPSHAPVKAEDPWNGRKRINFLLIGADAAGNRTGVRTDSMTVASVNIPTGNTVLFSLPRNLQHVHFTPGSVMDKQFPNGFRAELSNGGLLNEVWQYAEDYPNLGIHGPAALKDAISHTLNLHIDYYAMVDMYGFAALIDAIGGLRINVQSEVKYGGTLGTAGTIAPGYRLLNGEQVLWYGRSRVGSDDFSRMARQRCVIGALAQQASPAVVLANFNKIIKAAKRLFRTDIPQDLLEHLVNLGVKVKDAKITSTQFVPPAIYTGNPDWAKIRRMTVNAIRKSMASKPPVVAGSASPGATPGASATPSVSATPTATVSAGTSPSPTKNSEDQSISELCGF
ncbi:LCP family protein [Acrocarpospora catenulata]|uniref:LCP family protein n=1 Tax=Acrocarpospora catenulata TaxID=2836182 RepID=UPI001BD9B18C|nr:LCP family protein [Acrocarpospora catenulata]